MATFTKDKLSGSTLGRGIKLANATITSSNTTIHTGNTNASITEELWVYAVNAHTANVKITLGWGGSADPDNQIEFTVPTEAGLYLIIPGLIMQGNTTADTLVGVSNTTNSVVVYGYVNRIA
jgi:hypothetical protein